VTGLCQVVPYVELVVKHQSLSAPFPYDPEGASGGDERNKLRHFSEIGATDPLAREGKYPCCLVLCQYNVLVFW
jgi:hypothetical protein